MDDLTPKKPDMSKFYKPQKSQKTKKGSKWTMIALVVFFVLCFAGGGIAAFVMLMPSFNEDPYFKYVERGAPNEYAVVFGDEVLPEKYYAVKFEDDILIDAQFLIDFEIDNQIFWDSGEQILTISTPLKLIRMRPEEAFYTLNGENTPFPVKNTALYLSNQAAFIPLSFTKELYQITYSVSEEMKTVIIDSELTERTEGTVKSKNTAVRYEPDKKSDIAEKQDKGETVSVYGGQTEQGFLKVRTKKGVLGYIKASEIINIRKIAAEPINEDIAPPLEKYKGKRFSLVWDQIVGDGTSGWESEKTAGIDIASPTWLSLSSGQGDIEDVGSKDYVTRAKAAGYEVWPLFSNSFDSAITHEALKSTATRQKIIDSLIKIADSYGVNGINIDFESYKIEDGYYYTQFIKELAPQFRQNGIITSVDLPIPTLENSPTDREQIGKYADYVIVMTYDQHWASSPVSGPVAGYDWVEYGIERTLSYVPNEKVVMGLPLYTRIWYTAKDTGELTSRDLGMNRAYNLFVERDAKMEWEENTKYNRGEYEYDVEGVPSYISAWLETTETLKHKAELSLKYNLAGIGSWKKGLESPDVWEMLFEVLK